MESFRTLQERLSYLLKDKGITAYQLSRDTGMTQGSLSRILTGKTKKLREDNVKILADYFNISPDWLRGGTDSLFSAEDLKVDDWKQVDPDRLIAAYNTLATSYRVLAEAYTRLLDYLKNDKKINV